MRSIILVLLVAFPGVETLAQSNVPESTDRLTYAYTPSTPDHIAINGLATHLRLINEQNPDIALDFIRGRTNLSIDDAQSLLNYLGDMSQRIKAERTQQTLHLACSPNAASMSDETIYSILDSVDDVKEAIYLRHLERARNELSISLKNGLDELLDDIKPKVYYSKSDHRKRLQLHGVPPGEARRQLCEKLNG